MKKVNYFKDVDLKVDFPSQEKELLDKWYESGLVKKYLLKNSTSSKCFSFLDGPITANNPMAVHHAWGRTYKDLWQRFFNMKGYRQRFQNGFDCQGLWVEVEVEKELGLKSKKDIENLVSGNKKESIAKFVNLCKERVKKYSSIQIEQSKRLGYFMDWDNSYFTMSEDNNYMIWHFLKKCHEEKFIYKGHDVVAWCPRCETAISQHEMLTEDYKEVVHDAVFVSYPLIGEKDSNLLVWTTTPWTLPGNVAVALDPDKDYVEAGEVDSKQKYYLLKEAAKRLNLNIIKTIKGKDLIGMTYMSPFDELPFIRKSLAGFIHKVIATDNLILPVSETEGTGLIHIATGCGSEDFQLAKKEKLPVVNLIDDTATYIEHLGEFSRQNAKKHPEIIIKFLEETGNLFKTEKFHHRYPACWRCKTELVWKVADEWYISMDTKLSTMKKTLRQMMMDVTKKIDWIPDFGLERELDWLKNMHDWLISKKNRYWGLALPIWECNKCRSFEVIGGKDELKEKAIEGWDKFEGNSPHKPWVDEIKISCTKCGNSISRILDVGNPWLDAGIVPFSTISEDNKSTPLYWKDKKKWKNWYPADFITESFPGQFKNWFYSLIAMSTVLENMEPFKKVLGFGTLTGEDGRPMHKSWGNAIEFNEGADKIGVDVMRWMFVRQNPADNMPFGYRVADETRRRFILKLWNVYNFFVTYAKIDDWQPKKNDLNSDKSGLSILDSWILARLKLTISKTSLSLENFDALLASGFIENFVDDLSLWYIRRSRERVGPASEDEFDRNSFYEVTFYVLIKLSQILAPFCPFVSDMVYTNLTKEESVHLSDWPESGKLTSDDEKLILKMAIIRDIVEKVHAKRKEAEIPVRQPLSKVDVTLDDIDIQEELLKIALDELNVKKINLEKGGKIKVILDTKITPELEEEAKARELIRKIQGERRNLGFTLSDRVKIKTEWLPKDKEILHKIKKKTFAESLEIGKFEVKKV